MSKNKKEIIREAAIKVMAQEGFHEATIDKIASESKVAVGTIYNYFKNKEDILYYIVWVEYKKREDLFKKLIREDISPLKQLRAILLMHLNEVKQNPDVVKVILQERWWLKKNFALDAGDFKGLGIFFERIIEKGIGQGVFRFCNAEVIASALFGAIQAVMEQYIQEVESGKNSGILDKAAGELISLLQFGILR